jgi:hypothetical protein
MVVNYQSIQSGHTRVDSSLTMHIRTYMAAPRTIRRDESNYLRIVPSSASLSRGSANIAVLTHMPTTAKLLIVHRDGQSNV